MQDGENGQPGFTWQIMIDVGDLSSSQTPPTDEDGRRHHLAAVVDSRRKKVSLYVDGALKAQTDWTASTLDDSDKTNLVVGADSRGAGIGHVFHGNIDDVRVFHRALSAEEISPLCE